MIQARAHTHTLTRADKVVPAGAASDDDYADLMYEHILHKRIAQRML